MVTRRRVRPQPSRPGPATGLTRCWRTWPHLKLRRKAPRVEGALA